jgi:hypothetical protein
MNKLDQIQSKIERLERLKHKVQVLEQKIARSLSVAAPLSSAATPSLPIPSGTRARNVWPKSPEWSKATFQVLEVTGKSGAYYAPGVWFRTDEWEEAKAYLEQNMTKGNIWVSQAWIEGNELCTGSRKRVATK